MELFSATIAPSFVIEDEEATAQELAAAWSTIAAAHDTARNGMNQAASQTTDAPLKAALYELADGYGELAAAAAAQNKAAFDAILSSPGYEAAAQTVQQVCGFPS